MSQEEMLRLMGYDEEDESNDEEDEIDDEGDDDW